MLGDLHQIPVRDTTMDIVFMTEVLEHLSEPWRVLPECRRVLRPGGVLVLSTRFLFPYHPDPHDYYRFTEDGLRFLLRDFDQVAIVTLGNRLHVVWSALTFIPVVGILFRPFNILIGACASSDRSGPTASSP